MTLEFESSPEPTIGVEVEMQIVDLKTRQLVSGIHDILERIPPSMSERIKPEFLQSTLEINTDICHTLEDVRSDLVERLQTASLIAKDLGLGLVCAGTHPISSWKDQKVTSDPRYKRLLQEFQILGRRLAICGFHVHVGVSDGNKAAAVLDILRGYLPHLLAISTSSPFWSGYSTGMYSSRIKIFEVLPTAGLPPRIVNWKTFVEMVDTLISTNTIETTREIWWEARPHPKFGTIEVRVCDSPSTLEDMLTITALIHALVVHLCERYDNDELPEVPLRQVVEENKWQAARHGLDGYFINYDSPETMSIPSALRSLTKMLRGTAQSLGSLSQLNKVEDILNNGTSAHHQLEVYRRSGKLISVVDDLLEKLKV